MFGISCLLALAGGCATVPYEYGHNIENEKTLELRPGEPQIERGRPIAIVDGIGWVLGIPAKIILWNTQVDNHYISPETEKAIARYLATNQLYNVKVRLNEYAPGDEWSRLFRNKSVAWGWRYTLGVLSTLVYTIIPDRLFAGLLGGDHYNPWANSINIYSNHKAIGLHESGHAKDFAQAEFKGTYAAAYALVPFFALYPEAVASSDAISYLRAEGTAKEEKSAYKILYPAYGTYLGGSFGEFATPAALPLYIGVVVVGHITGRIKAGGVDERRARERAAISNQCSVVSSEKLNTEH